MINAYIELGCKLRLAVTVDDNLLLYEQFDYCDEDILNKLYQLLTYLQPNKVFLLTRAIFDTVVYDNAYPVLQTVMGDVVYNGLVTQVDMNKMISLLHAAKVPEILVYDRFQMYDHFMVANSCLVDYVNKSYIVCVKTHEIVSLVYVKEQNLEQTLLQQCRKYNVDKILDLGSYIDYECVSKFKNYAKVYEMSVYNYLTTCGYFGYVYHGDSLSIDSIRFDRHLQTVDYEPPVQPESAFSESVSVTKSDATEQTTVPEMEDAADEQNTTLVNNASLEMKQKPNKVKITLRSVIVIMSILIVLLIAGTLVASKYSNTMDNKCAIVTATDNRVATRLSKLQEASLDDYVVIYDKVIECTTGDCILASITVDTDIEVVFYLTPDDSIDVLKSNLSNTFSVNGVSEGSTITINDIPYSKVMFSLSLQ